MSRAAISPMLFRSLIVSVMIAGAGAVLAADPPSEGAWAPSKEQREQMALLHEKMAACLRSDKEIATCHEEMRSNCRALMSEQGCPMMGMHDQMLKHGPADPEDK